MNIEDIKPGEQHIGTCAGCGRVLIIEKPATGLTVCHEEPPCVAFEVLVAEAAQDGAVRSEGVGVYDPQTGRFHRS